MEQTLLARADGSQEQQNDGPESGETACVRTLAAQPGRILYAESIDLPTYTRQRDKLREELTLSQIDHHTEAVDELDVEGVLAFAERILPRAADPWVQAPLDYRQRLQQLFFPEGIAYDGHRFVRTAVTTSLLRYLELGEQESLASLIGLSWNQLEGWLRAVDGLRRAA